MEVFERTERFLICVWYTVDDIKQGVFVNEMTRVDQMTGYLTPVFVGDL